MSLSANLSDLAPAPDSKMSMTLVVALVCLFNTFFYNAPLISYVLKEVSLDSFSGVVTLALILTITFSISFLFLNAVSLVSIRLLKAAVAIFAVCNSLALFFVSEYGVILDRTMMGNLLNTNYSEASDFFSIHFLGFNIAFGVVPAFLFCQLSLARSRRIMTIYSMLVTFVGLLAISFIASSSWLWIDRHAKNLGGLIFPWSYTVNTLRHTNEVNRNSAQLELLPELVFNDDERTITVLVIGETARAQNFSLYGYERITNPLLAQQEIAVVPNSKSCTTYTTGSLRCMLSHLPDAPTTTDVYESLPSYLNRHGVEVVWRTNNWGEPPIEVGLYEKRSDIIDDCEGDDCKHDGALLHNLAQLISQSSANKLLIVLHQKGSHGPAYNERYPERFRKFLPECTSVELSTCTEHSLLNAYDNTIVYTDYFLASVIDTLRQFSDIPSTMIYMSDHGESLGENGLYLHGAPYMIAPEQQKTVPFLIWMSDEFKQLNETSIDNVESHPLGRHANIFHSVLGAFRLDSGVYQPSLDIYRRYNAEN